MTALRLIRIACAFVCVAGMTMAAACDDAPPSPVGPSSSSASSPSNSTGSWDLSGVVIGDDGRVISNTPVAIGLGHPDEPVVQTDGMGRYTVKFDAKLKGYVYGSTATVRVNAGADYEPETRLFKPVGVDPRQTLNFLPRRIRWIRAGESVSVTVGPDDAPCFNNVQDGSWYVHLVCRTVRLIAPANGVLTAEVGPAGIDTAKLEMEGPGDLDCCYQGNPLSMPVTAGMVIKISVEVVPGLPSRTFTLTTKIR